MSLQYAAYQISDFFIQKLEQDRTSVFEIFKAADLVESVEELREYSRSESINLEKIAEDVEPIFFEAKSILESEDESLSLDFDGKYLENVHLLLSGEGSWKMPGFIIAREEGFLWINALVGCHRIEDSDLEASYIRPSEVREIANSFPEILQENLKERWARVRRKATWDFSSYSDLHEVLSAELIPFYQNASEQNKGVLITLLP